MEVIGAVSSVVTLVEATSSLAKSLTTLAQRWQNAPEEILALAHATKDLATKFAYVEDTITHSPTTLLDGITRQGLMQLVAKAKTAMAELSILQKRLQTYGTLFQKAKWAVREARTAKAVLAVIKDIEEGLSMWINFISLKGHNLALQRLNETQRIFTVGIAEVKRMLSNVTMSHSLSGGASTSTAPTPTDLSTTPMARPPTPVAHAAIRREFIGIPWESSQRLRAWGFHGRIVKSTQGKSTDYDLKVIVHLPLVWLFGSYALVGELSLRTSSPRQNTLAFRHPSYLTIARVLDRSHPFFEACRNNNVAAVRRMLHDGTGMPTDVDVMGHDALTYAITYGGLEVVAELLDNGADIDGVMTQIQITPLKFAAYCRNIDVLRMLLQRGASSDHIDSDGIDVSFCCWYPWDWANKYVSAHDVFSILNEYILQDPGATWDNGVTALHAAANSADALEIDALVHLGLDVERCDDDGDVALVYAVQSGNSATYNALLAHGAAVESVHFRGEYLLLDSIVGKANEIPADQRWHTPAYEKITKDLLNRPLDLAAELPIEVEWTEHPESVRGRSVTAQELAAAYGPEIEVWFLEILQDCGRLENGKDKHRLRELKMRNHTPQGQVIGGVQDTCEDNGTEHISNDRESCTQRGATEMEEEERFWDAAECL